MFEKFTTENLESFRQRYEGTYGFYRDSAKTRRLVKLTSIGGTRCEFVDSDGIEFHLNIDRSEDIGFEFLPPRSMWYNTDQGAVYTQRMVQRQFQRGITAKNIAAFTLTDIGPSATRVDFPLLNRVFNTKEVKPDALLTRIGEGRSVAISPQFALTGNGLVYLTTENVGTYARKEKVFKFKLNDATLWKTEISDAIAALGCTAEVS